MRFFLGCALLVGLSVLPTAATAGGEGNNSSTDVRTAAVPASSTSAGTVVKADSAAESAGLAPAEAGAPASAGTSAGDSSAAASSTIASAAAASPAAASPAPQAAANPVPDSPLQFRLGTAFITPIGFMDFTGVFRNHNPGGGIGSSFGSIPYEFAAAPTTINLVNHLSEARLSMQNSRFGFRVDALVKGAHVIGYMEADFLGGVSSTTVANIAVSSNSNPLRSRLYWVDLAKGKWEILAGQTWSLITPGRTGISPIPGNIFFTNDIDVNYQAGLVWGRIPEFRFVFHPNGKAAIAFALDNQEQYFGGSAGGAKPLLPAPGGPVTVVGGVANLPGGQLNDGTTQVNSPAIFPDVIVKVALDPSAKFHFEFGGVERQFRVAVNTTAAATSPVVHHGMSGGGGFVNLNVQLFNGFRLLTNNFWSQGGGRYIYGQAPDLTVNPDGSLSAVRSSSTVTGFEYTHKNTLLYAYYGGIYVYRDIGLVNGAEYGYGVDATGPGSNYATAITQNRAIQEFTVGFNQTFWRDPKYGALNLMGQYSYLTRNPWSVAAGNPTKAKMSLGFVNLRYTLPGAAPAAAALR
jgi:hypothetical protein